MKTIVIESTPCPGCGKPTRSGALAGLCPACLLAQGVASESGDGGHGGRFVPPPLEDIAKLFPQLEILGLLGAGGMGAVYQARQPALDRVVALKILPAKGAGGANFEERFNREARALARLNHPNIVAVFEFGQVNGEGGLHFFIMEFVDGANLRQLEKAGRLSPREALQIIPQICDALQYAHDEGVVHRDIKPENVLVDRKGRVKIADFGLAKILGAEAESSRLTLEGQVMGTPHYMAPEQIEKPLSVDHRADIYSLGVVLYEMLTGDLPLGKFSPPSQKYQLDVRLDDVVLRALENDPARRYQKASEVKTQVEHIVDTPAHGAAKATSATPKEHQIKWLGCPVIIERDGQRQVNRKAAFKAFAIVFGIITLALLVVSLVTGRTLFGWLGISGGRSMQVRLLIAAIVTAWAVWRAWKRPVDVGQPRTPQGTVVLPPPGVSRKALWGACWAPLFFAAALLMLLTESIVVRGSISNSPTPSMQWWQILLSATVLPLGVAAPFGTTILGWLAVGDIRRSQARVTGLPLAVFDGIFFPLIAANALFLWAWTTSVRALAEATGNHGLLGPWPAIASVGAVLICVAATFDISRRVWRAVRRDSGTKPLSGAQRVAICLAALVAVAGGIIAVVMVTPKAKKRVARIPARHLVAQFDANANALVAKFPKRGTVSMLAVCDSGAAANAWWSPDGAPIPDKLYEARAQSDQLNAVFKNRDFIVRWRDLPSGFSGPSLRIEPVSGSVSSGGKVWRDGRELSNAMLLRGSFPMSTTTAAVWLGFGTDLWQPIAFYDANGNSSTSALFPEIPHLHGGLHQITEEGGNVVVTMIMEQENRDWNVRVMAVETNGVEHTYWSAASTPVEKSALWTYRYNLPRARLKEFQVQVRPVHWVEFRDVPLEPTDRNALGLSSRPLRPTTWSAEREVHVAEFFDFDKGVNGIFPTAADGSQLYRNTHRNPSWSRERGFDVEARTNELRNSQMFIIDLQPSDWDAIAISAFEQKMDNYYSPPSLPSTSTAKFPLTHGFRTMEGAMGILQITRFDEGRAGVKLRYKLIERAHFE